MKTQTFEEMKGLGATDYEARMALELFAELRPGLRVKRNGRVDTASGDKTPLGLLRVITRCHRRGGVLSSW